MAHHFEFDSERRILLVVLEGEVEEGEVSQYHGEARAILRKLNVAYAISDYSAVSGGEIGGDTVRDLAFRDAFVEGKIPRLIVTPQNYLYGLARMYELSANRTPDMLQILRSREQALKAIKVENPRFERLDVKQFLDGEGR